MTVQAVSEDVFSKADYLQASKKKHFLDILISQYKEAIFDDGESVMIACVGPPGSGKSTLSIKIAMAIDKHFSVKHNITWSVEELIEKIRSETKRAFVFEEAGVEIYSRNFMSKLNRVMSYIAQTHRFRRNLIIFNLPHIRQIDVDIRIMLKHVLLVKKFKQKIMINGTRKIVKWHAFFPWRFTTLWIDDGIYRVPEKVYYDDCVVEMGWVAFDPVPEEIYKEYEQRKMEWFEKATEAWIKKELSGGLKPLTMNQFCDVARKVGIRASDEKLRNLYKILYHKFGDENATAVATA